ncbi:hypothetical protein THRCLA_06090 [Thraustotheca clavata]|uniref:Uncharacterized protein n=1 Tax=Thraustotheca clavata TaxID=74557 RepID=A0A1V9ZQH1_9STRA|nr:hypothetical protein THRCLA_06090 [Thraustotheca clavata]
MDTAYKEIEGIAPAPTLRVSEAGVKKVLELPPFQAVAGTKAVYANVGGPVWAMDWLVDDGGPAYLAIGVHPTKEDGTVKDHAYNIKYTGENVLQIWSMPKKHPQTMSWVVGIRHNRGFAWDIKWNPHREHLPQHRQNGLGILACAFADGSIGLFQVPKNTSTPVIELEPFASTSAGDSVTLTLRWSLVNPYMFLSGACDGMDMINIFFDGILGCIQLWDVEEIMTAKKSKDKLVPLRRFEPVDVCCKQPALGWGSGWIAVRDIIWCPYDPYIFVSVGNDSNLRVWDIRQPKACIRSHRLNGLTWAISVQWSSNFVLQVASDQGSVMCLNLYTGGTTVVTWHPQIDSPVWQVALTEKPSASPVAVSCCASGTIRYVSNMSFQTKRKRTPSTQLFQWTKGGDRHLIADFTRALAPDPNLNAKAKRSFASRDVAIHRLSFGPVHSDWQYSVAFGGHSGVLVLRHCPSTDFSKQLRQRNTEKVLGRPRKNPLKSTQKVRIINGGASEEEAEEASASEGEADTGNSQSEVDTSDIADEDSDGELPDEVDGEEITEEPKKHTRRTKKLSVDNKKVKTKAPQKAPAKKPFPVIKREPAPTPKATKQTTLKATKATSSPAKTTLPTSKKVVTPISTKQTAIVESAAPPSPVTPKAAIKVENTTPAKRGRPKKTIESTTPVGKLGKKKQEPVKDNRQRSLLDFFGAGSKKKDSSPTANSESQSESKDSNEDNNNEPKDSTEPDQSEATASPEEIIEIEEPETSAEITKKSSSQTKAKKSVENTKTSEVNVAGRVRGRPRKNSVNEPKNTKANASEAETIESEVTAPKRTLRTRSNSEANEKPTATKSKPSNQAKKVDIEEKPSAPVVKKSRKSSKQAQEDDAEEKVPALAVMKTRKASSDTSEAITRTSTRGTKKTSEVEKVSEPTEVPPVRRGRRSRDEISLVQAPPSKKKSLTKTPETTEQETTSNGRPIRAAAASSIAAARAMKKEPVPERVKVKVEPGLRGTRKRPASEVIEIVSSPESDAESHEWAVGSIVHVLPRTWSGINRLGGAGRVTAVNNDNTVSVKYVLGGQDKNIPVSYISATPKPNSPKRGKV